MSCEYLALGACPTSFDNSEHVSGPHAVLVVDEQNNIPETGPTHSPEYPLNFPPFARRNHLVAPIGTTSIAQVARIKSRHLTRSTHGTPELPVKFAEEDVPPHLHEPECRRTIRGGSRGKGQHGESAGATTSSQIDE